DDGAADRSIPCDAARSSAVGGTDSELRSGPRTRQGRGGFVQSEDTMVYGGVDIVGEAWGFDAANLGVLSDEVLQKMFSTPIASGPGAGKFYEFCEGYVPLPGNT